MLARVVTVTCVAGFTMLGLGACAGTPAGSASSPAKSPTAVSSPGKSAGGVPTFDTTNESINLDVSPVSTSDLYLKYDHQPNGAIWGKMQIVNAAGEPVCLPVTVPDSTVTVQPCGGPVSLEATALRFWTCELDVPDDAYSSANCEKFVASNKPKIMVLYEVGGSATIRPCVYRSCQSKQLESVTEESYGSADTHQITTGRVMQVGLPDDTHALIELSSTVAQR